MRPQLDDCSNMVARRELEPAFHALTSVLLGAAETAGLKTTSGVVRKSDRVLRVLDRPYLMKSVATSGLSSVVS